MAVAHIVLPPRAADRNNPDEPRARFTRGAGEALLFGLVAISPWPFASLAPIWLLLGTIGIILTAALWAIHVRLTGRLAYQLDASTLALLGLILLTVVQLTPLPPSVLATISPTTAHIRDTFGPDAPERLVGEADVGSAGWHPISYDPARSRVFLAKLVAVLAVYVLSRNFVATPRSLHRLAWVGFGVGIALATLALAQHFSSPETMIYWWYNSDRSAFGPFPVRNYFPDYVGICLGLTLGLLYPRGRKLLSAAPSPPDLRSASERALAATDTTFRFLSDPKQLMLCTGAALMMASLAFSMSRGGMMSLATAGTLTLGLAAVATRGDGLKPAGVLLAFTAASAIGLSLWFGLAPVEARYATLLKGGAADSRVAIWRDVWSLAWAYPLAGAGNGCLVYVELPVRTSGVSPEVLCPHAYNECLEALVEGGVVRLALTLLLVGSVLSRAARGAVRLRGRSVSPLLIGAGFGLTAIAVHNLCDFGAHIPAVAILAAVVAGQVAASEDIPARGPASAPRNRPESPHRRGRRSAAAWTGRIRRWWPGQFRAELGGSAAVLAAGALAVTTAAAAVEFWKWDRVQRLLAQGFAVGDTGYRDDRLIRRGDYFEAAARLWPGSPEVRSDLSQARLNAAFDVASRPGAGGAGGAAGFLRPPTPPIAGPAREQLAAAVRAARAARDICPLLPAPHLVLGQYAALVCDRSDPPEVYFARAKRVAPHDPRVWYASGTAALARGDAATAWADLRESLARSADLTDAVVHAAARHLSPDEIRATLLPNRAGAWWAAAGALYPNPAADRDARRPFVAGAKQRWDADPPTEPAELLDWAAACEELGDRAAALGVWRRALTRDPNSVLARDQMAALLEADELYDEAVEHLTWLAERRSAAAYRDRLDAARHALKLKRDIDGR